MFEKIKKIDKKEFLIRGISLVVAINALSIIFSTLIDQRIFSNGVKISHLSVSFNLIAGLILLYFSRLLSRRKMTARLLIMSIYSFVVIFNLFTFISYDHPLKYYSIFRNFLVPLFIFLGLLTTKPLFIVKSDTKSFASSIKFISLLMLITFIYGVLGFMLMDNKDFHQEINFYGAIKNTIDQFGLTGQNYLPYTYRARLFLDSLSIISITAIFLSVTSLFKPIKSRFIDQNKNREIMHQLLLAYPACSEDFFKIWPHDKDYYFNDFQTAGVAYKAHNKHALVIADPAGNKSEFPSLLKSFNELCYVNDWEPVFVHVDENNLDLYKRLGLQKQKLGEEAIVNIENFQDNVLGSKYFRNIVKRFEKNNYSYEVLKPPHSGMTLNALRNISREWLALPGRSERGLIMGYFSFSYMQQCNILVAKNENNEIVGFINQVPSYDLTQGNYDLLRHSKKALGNINDYLMVSFINECSKQGYETVNLGLCPLSGIDVDESEESQLINRLLKFMYNNGDKLYSFSGLRKYKAKYDPNWSPRYICYRGSFIDFTKAINSLNKSWKVHIKN